MDKILHTARDSIIGRGGAKSDEVENFCILHLLIAIESPQRLKSFLIPPLELHSNTFRYLIHPNYKVIGAF